jgi:hypothetical protein
MILSFALIVLLFSSFAAKSQINPPPFDTLSRDDIFLLEIDLRYGNSYKFTTNIVSDSVIFILPNSLAKGYYEAYFNNDSNRLALAYYNFGNKSYAQQFYADGSMKSDSEYDRYGYMHGMHTVYDRNADEIWHADYWHGSLDLKYTFEYLEAYNYTDEFISSNKAWGCYEFSPSPMRERHDQIHLRKDGSFSYHNFKADCDCRRHSEGKWTFEKGLLLLHIDKKDVWLQGAQRRFALIARRKSKKPVLVEVSEVGLNWYASEYYYCKKCQCITNSEK